MVLDGPGCKLVRCEPLEARVWPGDAFQLTLLHRLRRRSHSALFEAGTVEEPLGEGVRALGALAPQKSLGMLPQLWRSDMLPRGL